MQDRWLDCVARLETELPAQQFKPWIKPLVFLGFDPGSRRLRLGVPGQFKLNLIRAQFESRISAIAADQFGGPVDVIFELLRGEGNPTEAGQPSERSEDKNQPAESVRGVSSPGSGQQPPQLRTAPPEADDSRLRADLCFDNFVAGKANQMAWSATLQVVEHPGTQYNPLFLYGGVGLGKTHLLHAAGNALRSRLPGMRVRYIHAQDYFDEMVRGIQRKSLTEFKAKYQSLDLLLVDDIQFLGGKDRTQEEFFYTFEALLSTRKQLILTCDSYPKEMSGMEERLVSRFGSGLIVEIEPPELEMRVAILLKKAELSDARLPEEVAFFIAKHMRSNVRELEGALLRVIAYARFRGKPVTAELARDALKDIIALNRAPVSIESIQKTVADFYKLKVADMYSKRRPAHIARARQIAMYLAKELTQKSFPEIGEAFGGRDHTTVMHAVKRVVEIRQHDQETNRHIHALEQTLRG
jgi:chromosomal replication initiator protein